MRVQPLAGEPLKNVIRDGPRENVKKSGHAVVQTLCNNTAHLRLALTIDFRQQNIARSPKALEMVL